MTTELKVRDIMSSEVMAVAEDLTVGELATFLTDHEISGVPVTRTDGMLLGVVSVTDITRCASLGGPASGESDEIDYFRRDWEDQFDEADARAIHIDDDSLRVRDIMTTEPVFTIPGDESVSKLARRMLEAHIHRMLVTEKEQVIGIVSTSDLLQLLAESN